ncbi:MAG: LysR family transcriptional regulator, partial [Verrucomicrobiaceae bacterium]
MEWLNYHHLRYFWTVARKGGVRKAAEELHVSQPSISAQLRLLEEAVGEKLFRRSGRNLVLTEMGHLVLSYADEIFSAGRELMNAVKQRPGSRALRLNVGMTDSLPK